MTEEQTAYETAFPPSGERETDERRIIERARDAVSDMCNGSRRWTMSVPAEPDRDHDLVITAALDLASRLLVDLRRPSAPVEAGEVSVDASTVEKIVRTVLANPKSVDDYRAGKTAALGFLVGQGMRAVRVTPPVDETPSPDPFGDDEPVQDEPPWCKRCGIALSHHGEDHTFVDANAPSPDNAGVEELCATCGRDEDAFDEAAGVIIHPVLHTFTPVEDAPPPHYAGVEGVGWESVPTRLGRVYDTALVQARAAAYGCGYALAVHGSEMRDLDLIAVPWTEEATSAEDLAVSIRNLVRGAFTQGDPTSRPHGRLTWAIHLKVPSDLLDACAAYARPFRPYLDLSVIPAFIPVEDAPPRASIEADGPLMAMLDESLAEVAAGAPMVPREEVRARLSKLQEAISAQEADAGSLSGVLGERAGSLEREARRDEGAQALTADGEAAVVCANPVYDPTYDAPPPEPAVCATCGLPEDGHHEAVCGGVSNPGYCHPFRAPETAVCQDCDLPAGNWNHHRDARFMGAHPFRAPEPKWMTQARERHAARRQTPLHETEEEIREAFLRPGTIHDYEEIKASVAPPPETAVWCETCGREENALCMCGSDRHFGHPYPVHWGSVVCTYEGHDFITPEPPRTSPEWVRIQEREGMARWRRPTPEWVEQIEVPVALEAVITRAAEERALARVLDEVKANADLRRELREAREALAYAVALLTELHRDTHDALQELRALPVVEEGRDG